MCVLILQCSIVSAIHTVYYICYRYMNEYYFLSATHTVYFNYLLTVICSKHVPCLQIIHIYVMSVTVTVHFFFCTFSFMPCIYCISIDVESENFEVSQLSKETLNTIEADSFWCTSKLLDGIQDNYTFAQPGIQMKVRALKELIKRIDGQSSI